MGAVIERIPGDYTIVLKDDQGQELALYPFTPQPFRYGPPASIFDLRTADVMEEERELLGIHQLVPHVAGTTTIENLGTDDMAIGRIYAHLLLIRKVL